MSDPRQPVEQAYQQLCAKADAFFARVYRDHRRNMQCCPGCSDCCQQELTVLSLEAQAIGKALRALPASVRQRIAEQGAGDGPPCAMLLDGRCAIYAARPLVCRTHGLPIEQCDSEDGQPATLSVCPLNFTDEIPHGAVLDGYRLVAMLTTIDKLAAANVERIDDQRVSLRTLAANANK